MNANLKLASFVSFFLMSVMMACSIGSMLPSANITPTAPKIGSVPSNTPSESKPTTLPEGTSTLVATNQSIPAFVEQVSNQANIPAGASGTVIAACPSTSQMLGGGFASVTGVTIIKTMPDPAGWLVTGINHTTEDIPLTSYVYCLHNEVGVSRVNSTDELISGWPSAQCPDGDIITGGGYSFETDTMEVYLSTPNGDSSNPANKWSVQAVNHLSTDQSIRVFAVCLSGSSLSSTLARDDKVSYTTGVDSTKVTITCPTGAVMVGGGYEGTGTFISRVDPADTGLWDVQAREKVYFDGSLDHAVCLNLP